MTSIETKSVKGGFPVWWDRFPYVMDPQDGMNVTEGEWNAHIVAKYQLVFTDQKTILRHIVAHPDEWTGDVFPIIAILTERLHEFRERA